MPAQEPTPLSRAIEHTLLRADATPSDIEHLCGEALRFGLVGVCVNPRFVRLASRRLDRSGVLVVSVVGFPLGMTYSVVKAREASLAASEGADEIDMVAPIGLIKSGEWQHVEEDIAVVAGAAASSGAALKVIIEACYLTDEEKLRALEVSVRSGARFVKTSTGFGPSGATVEDVALLHNAARGRVGIKAAGGIRTRAFALALLEAGATRIGTSAGPSLLMLE